MEPQSKSQEKRIKAQKDKREEKVHEEGVTRKAVNLVDITKQVFEVEETITGILQERLDQIYKAIQDNETYKDQVRLLKNMRSMMLDNEHILHISKYTNEYELTTRGVTPYGLEFVIRENELLDQACTDLINMM